MPRRTGDERDLVRQAAKLVRARRVRARRHATGLAMAAVLSNTLRAVIGALVDLDPLERVHDRARDGLAGVVDDHSRDRALGPEGDVVRSLPVADIDAEIRARGVPFRRNVDV